jgi:hypothetical protein
MITFGAAIELMKAGQRVWRKGWNGKGMWLYLTTFPGFDPCIVMHTAGGTEQPGWLASQADMLANDWLSDASQEGW